MLAPVRKTSVLRVAACASASSEFEIVSLPYPSWNTMWSYMHPWRRLSCLPPYWIDA